MTSTRHEHDGAAASNLAATVSGADRRTLDAIFRHPLSHNLEWREIVSLFNAIGGSEEKHNGEFELRAGAHAMAMKKPHTKDVTGQEVMDLRHFLERSGWSPTAKTPEPLDQAATSSLVVVIDHAGARVYRIERAMDGAHFVAANDSQHILHQLDRKTRDADRDETYPRDETFFEEVARAMSNGGRIVVISHGKGQSNEADHLSAYLQAHHKSIHERIVREIVADLPHLTTPELLALGRNAFADA